MIIQSVKNIIKLFLSPHRIKEKIILWYLIQLPRFKVGTTNILKNKTKYSDPASFSFIYEEVFIKEIYRFSSKKSRPLIIDCGANIGLSVIYFKKLFPKANVIAFEPDKDVFEILKHNIKSHSLDDVSLIKKGLWKEEATLCFQPDGADGGRLEEVGNDNTAKIDTVRLSNYLDNEVDFLKIDIEGAEIDVLAECKSKLKNVKNIFVEYHSFKNKPQELDTIFAILKESGFRYYLEHIGVRSSMPYCKIDTWMNMDLQLNIFGYRS